MIFWDVDTQFDFMEPAGSLFVKGAPAIVENLRALFRYARDHRIPIISSADTHVEDDPEFRAFPRHCVKGSPGQQRLPVTLAEDHVVVENKKEGPELEKKIQGRPQVIVEKQAIDVFTNPNIDEVLKHYPKDVALFGVATEHCVRATALGLRRRGFRVRLVTDAIAAVDEQQGRNSIREMEEAGCELVTTREVTSR
ncbi:MAG: cysteine hydrolase [Acidobacteria bacterium]|nr:cysteine hydrolase [Acidobacteriota bacterium]